MALAGTSPPVELVLAVGRPASLGQLSLAAELPPPEE